MNELLNQWLDARLSVPGMVACGVALSGTSFCRSTDANFTVEQMAQIIGVLQATATAPGIEAAALRWHDWVFANGKIRFAVRADGWVFGAAVRANSDAAQILDPLTEEFLTLKPAG